MKRNGAIGGLLCLLCLLLLCGCGRFADRVKPVSADVRPAGAQTGVHRCARAREALTRVSRAEMTVLYYDEESRSIAVYDANARQLWRALPAEAHPDAAMLTLTVLCGKELLTLNTQDDCDPAKTEVTLRDNGVQFLYHFDAQPEGGDRLQFTLPLAVTVTDGCMRVELDCAGLREQKLPRGAKLLSAAVLPFFGAQQSGEENDYLLVPDGCGSVIRTKPEPAAFEPLAVPAYTPNEDGACARVPAFGQRVGSGAFVALCEAGDALLTVHAEKKTTAGGVNRVYPAFALTETAQNDRGVLFAAKKTTDAAITLSYRFLADETASPMGLAAACRELLLRNGTLDLLSPIRGETTLPFHLSLIGAALTQSAAETKPTIRTLTGFSEAREILQYLRSKGVDNIRLRYRGLLLGGPAQQKAALSSTVSGGENLGAFQSAVRPLGVTVFPELRLLTAQETALPKAARTLLGARRTQVFPLLQTPVLSGGARLAFCAADRLQRRAESLLVAMRRLGADRLCVADAAGALYTDAGSRTAPDAQKLRCLVSDALSLLSGEEGLLLDGANLYAVKSACGLLNVPLDAVYESDIATPVPFLQAILHGYTFYSGEAMNLQADPVDAMLCAAQVGAAPYYEWYAADFGTADTPDHLCYVHAIAQAQQCCRTLQTAFEGLCDKPITDYRVLRAGVTCTVFGSAKLYVNRTDRAVSAEGVTVEPRSVLRVDA